MKVELILKRNKNNKQVRKSKLDNKYNSGSEKNIEGEKGQAQNK